MNSSPASAENISRGIGLTVASIVLFGLQDVASKFLVQEYAVPQIVMLRFWAFGGFSIFLALRQHGVKNVFSSRRVPLQLLRGALMLVDLLLFAHGLRTLPLGEAAAITLMFPIFITLFSIPILGEKVGPFRWFSVAVGFLGVLIVLRPGIAIFDVGALFILAATTIFSLYAVLTRKVALVDSTATCMIFVGAFGLLGSTLIGMFYWQAPSLQAWGMILLLMGSTTGANYLVMRALACAPASVVQPFNYLLLPWAIFLGLVVFGQLMDFVALIGAIIIVGAGLMVWFREKSQSPSSEQG